jgi:Pentapeptide repeats (8 copies)
VCGPALAPLSHFRDPVLRSSYRPRVEFASEEGRGVRRAVAVLVLTGGLLIALAGCGGGGTKEVNGCRIEANTSCPGVDLTDADLSGEDLSGADLSGATMRETNLSDANLTEANLTSAQITDANFQDADLTRANLTDAVIEGTDLDGATLCGTIRTDGTTDDSDCPSSGGATTTTTTTATTGTTATTSTGINPNLPEIVSLDAPASVKCPQGTAQVSVTVSWATRKATELTWQVDGQQIDGPTELSGSGPFAFDCSAAQHTYSIRASNDRGDFAADSVTVQRSR